jgi:hypothetical protein
MPVDPGRIPRELRHLEFEAVEFIQLHRSYPGLVLRFAASDEAAMFTDLAG